MGSIPAEKFVDPVAWGNVELDLFGPYWCRGDVNKRTKIKVWGIIIVDKNSSAIHCDVVMDYGSQEVIKTLKRFGSLRGWPSKVTSDPGSQLESASGSLTSWWEELQVPLQDYAMKKNFTWEISPANSPWRQGKSESCIRVIKRLLKISVGDIKLSPLEFQTALFEAANLTNEKPLGINKKPLEDGSYRPLTPNQLIIGRSTSDVPDDANLAEHLKKSERLELIKQVTDSFWKRWVEEVVPESVVRQKWHESARNLTKGDIVLVHASSPIKGKYIMGVVEDVNTSKDKLVRSCSVGYRVPDPKDPPNKYDKKHCGRWVSVKRSIQRLSLLLPVEEQKGDLTVEDNKVIPSVMSTQEISREPSQAKPENSNPEKKAEIVQEEASTQEKDVKTVQNSEKDVKTVHKSEEEGKLVHEDRKDSAQGNDGKTVQKSGQTKKKFREMWFTKK